MPAGEPVMGGVVRVLDTVPGGNFRWSGNAPDPATSGVAPCRLFNIGNAESVELLRYIAVLEQCFGRKAQTEMLPLQAGDVPAAEADVPGEPRNGLCADGLCGHGHRQPRDRVPRVLRRVIERRNGAGAAGLPPELM
jgi:hypothetical protein